MFYQKIIRPILFRLDAELVHNLTMALLALLDKSRLANKAIFRLLNFTSPRLKQKLLGLYFRTPVGLAAGLDKKAAAPLLWSAFDFGWCELGSFTAQPWAGNARPRLWRIPAEQGIIVHSGLPNKGAKKVADKLRREKKLYPKRGLWGISIAKTPSVALEQAADDYAQSFKLLSPLADIITLNLSCPNVSDFAGLQKKNTLEPILAKITALNKARKPLFIKIGNDLAKEQLDDIIILIKKYRINGIIAANLSKKRDQFNLSDKYQAKPGGISGRLIADKANRIIAYLYRQSEGKYIVIGCGGVFTGQDAFTKIQAGASLVQLVTGFIYGGPTSIKNINRELDELLAKNHFTHISQAVGAKAHDYAL